MSDADEKLGFEKALERLESVVTRLEQGELELEESLKLYEDGIRLSRLCHTRLEEAEGRIEMLLKDARGELTRDADGEPRKKALARDSAASDRPGSGGKSDAP